jgi:phosphoribosylaminoimidazolecarboxamide formyltransferase / IMP cyclohydrolase
MNKAALLSVSDKTGLTDFSRLLAESGFTLLTTSGTGKFLTGEGIESLSIEKYTGQKEILDGRVKTLHPKIHAGLLARRDDPKHMSQLEEDQIMPIQVAVINLYPFIQNLQSAAAKDPGKMIELVDIGGPTMIRAAAKNFKSIFPLIDPADYESVGRLIKAGETDSQEALELRRKLATKVFAVLADYNLEIARYFSNVSFLDGEGSGNGVVDDSADYNLGEMNGLVLRKQQTLRYGENPHQKGAFYSCLNSGDQVWEQLNGKALSYNNFLDFDAACRMLRSFSKDLPTVAIFKHLNPCGAARDASLLGALEKAKLGDPRSHFGGIIALNKEVTGAAAENIVKDFAEIIVAPAYNEDALKILCKKKNLRVIKVDTSRSERFESRSAAGGVLIQEVDPGVSNINDAELVSDRKATNQELKDLQFAWLICSHVKSNAITLVKNEMLIGTGAGQMSRIDSVDLALSKARTHGHEVKGAVAGSDAFFPFSDALEALSANGVMAVVEPGGSMRDDEIIAKAKELDMCLLFTGDRHFRH